MDLTPQDERIAGRYITFGRRQKRSFTAEDNIDRSVRGLRKPAACGTHLHPFEPKTVVDLSSSILNFVSESMDFFGRRFNEIRQPPVFQGDSCFPVSRKSC